MRKLKIIINGIIRENPTFVLVLGMCPTLATTSTVSSGVGMGLAAAAVLVGSNAVISMIRKFVPSQVRIPCYIVVIAAFVTVLQMLMQAFLPDLYKTLGIFIPLIVVNCIILGRAEAFASKNTVADSVCDGIGMGLGFTFALFIVSLVRESIGIFAPMATMPPGGFIVLGCLLAGMNHLGRFLAKRSGKPEPEPLRIDCRHCVMGCRVKD